MLKIEETMVKKLFGCRRKKARREQNQNGTSSHHCQVTPLSQKKGHGVARVCTINGDRKQCARMASLGLYPGNEIELLSVSHGDSCLIKVHGGTVSIDHKTMENILVSE